jgi:PncC family amidohydrolase
MEMSSIEKKPYVPVEYEVVELLQKNKLKVTFAESCTGGLLSARLVNVPGASEVFKSSVVTYSNKAKRKLLGVNKCTLKVFGAVSSQTAAEMAIGAMRRLGADVSVSITGIAGPGGGTDKKPVGLVYIACNVLGNVTIKECHFSGERLDVRMASVEAALNLMKDCLNSHFMD